MKNKKTEHVRLLDCTLRDGGHIVNGEFGELVIKNTIRSLVEAKVDIIEVGFLWDKVYGTDTARYYTIADVKRILPKDRGESEFALMADFIDLEHLEPCDGTIKYIRLSFKRHRLEWGLKTARMLMEKGYKCFINPVNCNVYTDEQYLDVLKRVNELKPHAFSIVDTFGVMRLRDLSHIYYLVENNLDPDIAIGLHLHENLGLAYSLAQHYLSIANPKRNIVIDASLLGIGRDPGNLCIEQIMDYMNYEYGDRYNVEIAFDAIDDYISPLKQKFHWGYNIPYALSGKYHLHRTYAEYLMGKYKIRTSDIERILKGVDISEAEMFNEQYIEKLYREYMSVEADNSDCFKRLREAVSGREILVIAPGVSVNEYKNKLICFINEKAPLIITVHCNLEDIAADFKFFTTIKRYDLFHTDDKKSVSIVTSNLKRYEEVDDSAMVVSYQSLAYHDGIFSDDSVLMLLNLLSQIGVDKVNIAGFDGFNFLNGDFYIEEISRSVDKSKNDDVKKILSNSYKDIEINFITPSYYEGYDK